MSQSGRPYLGCIADDFTGATDLANNLVRAGMRTVQSIGLPVQPVEDADCVVIALKSRTIPSKDAISQSLSALDWLEKAGCTRFYFKVCSTFDSTPEGNIGPVAEALMDRLGIDFCCVTPAFPANARTVFKGYLFVGEVLLSESGMRNHPLTPMTDANLVRVLESQSRGRVGLVPHEVVRQGAAAIRQRVLELKQSGLRFGIVDAIADDDLMQLGRALADDKLVVAGSGVAIGLPQNIGLDPRVEASELPAPRGLRAIVSGSCSVATNGQVADFISRGGEAFAIDPLQLASGGDLVARVLDWARGRLASKPVLVYSTATPERVRAVQQLFGANAAGALVEDALAAIARGLVSEGVGQLIVAGGETSGACVQALKIAQMRIGPQIDPGVPWCHAQTHAEPIHIALKSGNFGSADFFTKAFEQLR